VKLGKGNFQHRQPHARRVCPPNSYRRRLLRAPFVASLLALLLLTLPAAVQAQSTFTNSYGIWDYETNNGAVTVTGCAEFSSAVVIPATILVNGVSLPVTSIGDEAFANPSLISASIPNSVTNIGAMPFGDCFSLTAITVAAQNLYYSSTNGVLFNKSQTTLIEYPGGGGGNYSIPGSVTNISAYAFYGCVNLTDVTIPGSVTSIGDYAFYYCSGLTNDGFTNGVISIGDSAYAYCSSLTSVNIPDGVTNIGTGAFYLCNSLNSATIGNGVASITGGAFEDCYTLSSFMFSTSVQSIGDYALSYCNSLTNVTIPDSVTNIGSYAFFQCPGLTSVIVPGSVTSIGGYAFCSCAGLTNATIANGVGSIGDSAYAFCTGLTNVLIPNSVTNLGEVPFAYSSSLRAITVGEQNSFYSSSNGVLFNKNQTTLLEYPGGIGGSYTIPGSVTNIAYEAFEAASLTSVTIPKNVTTIGESAFSLCNSLTSASIGGGVTSFGAGAFQECASLSSVTIADGVNSIGQVEFAICPLLTSVTIPDSVTNIQAGAFEDCSALTSIIIPASVLSIGDSSFYNCTNLTGVYFEGNVPVADPTIFYGDTPIAYYLSGAAGWGPTFAGVPTEIWVQQTPLVSSGSGVKANKFGFTITGSSNLVVVVEACTNLAKPVWSFVATNTLTDGSCYFSDPQWTNYHGRFYRVVSQ
jgi:hypothetical protein